MIVYPDKVLEKQSLLRIIVKDRRSHNKRLNPDDIVKQVPTNKEEKVFKSALARLENEGKCRVTKKLSSGDMRNILYAYDKDLQRHLSRQRIIPIFIINNKSVTNPDNARLAQLSGINRVGQLFLYRADWCPDGQRAKTFLNDNRINYAFIDVDKNSWAADETERINSGKRMIPTLVLNDQSYTNPDNKQSTDLLETDEKNQYRRYDLIIIGALGQQDQSTVN